MEYFIGAVLALAVSVFATLAGFDRDRAFYPTVLIVVASYYGLFAVIGGGDKALAIESGVLALFVLASIFGFKRNLWIVAAALAGHGIFDIFHDHLISNAGVPAWWPMFCMTYDVTAGAYLAWRLKLSKPVA